MSFANLNMLTILKTLIDILLVWYVVYKLLTIVRGTKAVQLLRGIFIILIVRIVSEYFSLTTLSWMTEQAITWGFLAIIIIFQPELRRALEQIGRGKFFTRGVIQEVEDYSKLITSLIGAVEYLSARRMGALITIERDTGLNDYTETGTPLDSVVSQQILANIFIPNSPLHDGAVIIRKNRIAAAACYLPLSDSPFISKELGTRHRAALGVSEVTDSITVVVSEETGAISVAHNGELFRNLSVEEFQERLQSEFTTETITTSTTSNGWRWRVKKNG